MDLRAAQYNNSLLMLLDIREEGYEICLASEHIQDFYDKERIHAASGGDFFDLVRGYGRLLSIPDSREDIRLAGANEVQLGFRSLLGMPLSNERDELTGLMVLMNQDRGIVTPEIMEDFKGLAIGIEDSLRYLSVEAEINAIRNVDPLTRLVSRERMMSVIKLEFARSQRSDIPFSMILIDIDDFSTINENFGHEVGDQVLREFSEEIAERVRLVDTACRWDGDVFAVLCPQTDLLGANTLVNDLFSSLTHHLFPNVGRCYFSVGIADYSPKDTTINDMLLRLDKALYRVKVFGGNGSKTRYH